MIHRLLTLHGAAWEEEFWPPYHHDSGHVHSVPLDPPVFGVVRVT